MNYCRTLVLILAAAAALAGPSGQGSANQSGTSSDIDLVSQARQVVGAMLARLPNYTCLETLEQTARAKGDAKFRLIDRVRVEVAFIDGTELYAWPGSPKFVTRDIQQVIGSHGAVGTGDFGGHLRTTYAARMPLQLAGKDSIGGRDAWRFTETVPANRSQFAVIAPPAKANVGYKVNAWHDAASLALLRFELIATRFPRGFPVQRTMKATEYQTVSVNGLPVRLPAMTELSMTTLKGVEDRTVSTFSNCREYVGESKLIFDEPGSGPQGSAPQPAEVIQLPPGLIVRTALDTAVELTDAARGDLVVTTVAKDVFENRRKVLSAGAKVTGRLRYVRCEEKPLAYCFAVLKPETFRDGTRSGPFAATLTWPAIDLNHGVDAGHFAGRGWPPIPDEIAHVEEGAAALYTGMVTRLPRGYRLIWRTLEVSGGSKP